ncbi:DUF6240 domain-containing protein [Fictibacillus phosphorivorans]|uniref:DUF6240 domain-containing protein n=1 Tax=Fictibacillus phosphorivorans TaxID=1221500 RepID=UPI00203EDB2B|nr:DUF6240 domain-containing protein [Fictibacillus phosphorivorans]MCM3717177.1 hypothetical protein [Fictibacillus phosphorivorans]MCM3774864.1 hypothetical protein [Fictibacillus phosphorivorans]
MLSTNNIIQPPPIASHTSANIQLKLDQLLTAKILEIFPDQTAKILYQGTEIHAKLEAPLTKGNHYLFEVGEKNGVLILKKVDTDPMKSTTEQMLQKLHLSQTENNKKAAEFLISEKMTVTKENVKQVAIILQLAANISFKEKKEVIQRMQALEIPAKPALVQAVLTSIQSKSAQAEMRQLFESLTPYIHKDKSIRNTVELLQSLYGFKTSQSVEKEVSVVSSGFNGTKNVSKQNSGHSGHSDLETKSFHLPKETIHNQITLYEKEVQGIDTKRQASTDFLQAVQKWFHKSGMLHERNIMKEPVLLMQTDSLKANLITLRQHVESLGLPESISFKTEQALNKLTSQQIQNISVNEHLHQFVLQIPLGQNENPKEISIRWEGKKHSGQPLDPDHCRMVFCLEMKHLKDIAVDVQIQNRILSLKVFSSHSEIEKLSKAFLPSLKKKLNEMNYTLSSLHFVQNSENEMKIMDKRTAYKGMDVRI